MQQERYPRFLLVGHDGSHNRGCEALVRTTVSILREEYPQARFTVASRNPEADQPLLDIENLDIIHGLCQLPSLHEINSAESSHGFPKNISWKKTIWRLVRAALPHGVVVVTDKRMRQHRERRALLRPSSAHEFTQVRHLKNAMLAADMVISVGGDTYIEDFGPPTYYLELLEYAQHLKRKTMVWGASIWPFKDRLLERRLQQTLSSCDLITVRDYSTLDYLSSLNVATKIELVADGAFLMLPNASERTQLEWTAKPGHVVGFNCTTLFMRRFRKVVPTLVEFMRDMIDAAGWGVVLIPHDRKERELQFEIQLAVDRPEAVILAPLGLNAPETKYLIGQCDAFVGMRFHPTIASLSQGVPTLGLSYSPKFAGLHELVYGHRDYLIPYEDVSVDLLKAKVGQLLNNRDEIRRHLLIRVAELQQMARRNGTLVKEILG